MREFTVGKLRKLIENVPDDTIVLTHGYDHSYDSVDIRLSTSLFDGVYEEDFGEQFTPETEDKKRVQILLID